MTDSFRKSSSRLLFSFCDGQPEVSWPSAHDRRPFHGFVQFPPLKSSAPHIACIVHSIRFGIISNAAIPTRPAFCPRLCPIVRLRRVHSWMGKHVALLTPRPSILSICRSFCNNLAFCATLSCASCLQYLTSSREAILIREGQFLELCTSHAAFTSFL